VDKELRETVADLLHEFWSGWTNHMTFNPTAEDVKRWKFLASIPYSELSETDKEKDRLLADKVIELIFRKEKSLKSISCSSLL